MICFHKLAGGGPECSEAEIKFPTPYQGHGSVRSNRTGGMLPDIARFQVENDEDKLRGNSAPFQTSVPSFTTKQSPVITPADSREGA